MGPRHEEGICLVVANAAGAQQAASSWERELVLGPMKGVIRLVQGVWKEAGPMAIPRMKAVLGLRLIRSANMEE